MAKSNNPLFEDKLDNYFIVQDHTSLQFPLHVHSYIEIVHILQGTLEMQIGSQLYILSEGDFTIIFPNVMHSYHTLSDDEHTNLAISNCSLSMLPMHKPILLNNHPQNPIIHPMQLHPDMQWIENRLSNVNPLEDNTIFVSALFSMMLCHSYPYLKLEKNIFEETENLTEKVISYVSRNCLEDISLESIATHFGISKFKLSRLFSNVIKSSFPDYLKRQRINNAEFLLINTDKDITSIAYECGFNNQQCFNRAFKEIEGMTPSAFRNQKIGTFYPDNCIPLLPEGMVVEITHTYQPIFISG